MVLIGINTPSLLCECLVIIKTGSKRAFLFTPLEKESIYANTVLHIFLRYLGLLFCPKWRENRGQHQNNKRKDLKFFLVKGKEFPLLKKFKNENFIMEISNSKRI